MQNIQKSQEFSLHSQSGSSEMHSVRSTVLTELKGQPCDQVRQSLNVSITWFSPYFYALQCSEPVQMITWSSWIGLEGSYWKQIKDDCTLSRDRAAEDLAWYNNHNPHWIPTDSAQKNNPWITTYIRSMMFTWGTEAHRPHPSVWIRSITELSFGCESFALLFYTPKSNLHFYSNEGSLQCSTTFSIPQVQSFHREWAQSLIYISAVNCDCKYKTHWGLVVFLFLPYPTLIGDSFPGFAF